MLSSKAMMAAPAAVPQYIEDVFSTWLYTGNDTLQTITNGIDLAGKGGMVWVKSRSLTTNNRITDTVRGATKSLSSNLTDAQITENNGVNFTSSGFTVNDDSDYNASPNTYCSWTFREAPKFFDVVTYTGNGVAGRNIAHNLGSVPGMIIVKRTDVSGNWAVYHRSLTATKRIFLNQTEPQTITSVYWNDTAPTSTVFSLGTDSDVNASGSTYVAYLFAHDAGGFGEAGDQNVVSCGTYNGNGSAAGRTITLGYEPQWLMIKNAAGTGNWQIIDNMRGMPVGSADATLQANLSNAESAVDYVSPLATGFQITSTSSQVNTGGEAYIYLAIRRGPMKTPTVGTEVFSPLLLSNAANTKNTTNFAIDTQLINFTTNTVNSFFDRLRGISSNTTASGAAIRTSTATVESTVAYTRYWDNTGFTTPSATANTSTLYYSFVRAPKFFDVVAYTGNGLSSGTRNHNLTVQPELIMVRARSDTAGWTVVARISGTTYRGYGLLNGTNILGATVDFGATISSTVFPAFLESTTRTNTLDVTYVAYLFATLTGISKVGFYTGTGTTQQINCGFSTGARFVMVKRTDVLGDWFVWDTARGITSGSDPYLTLNESVAQVTGTDYIDPLASGFEISSTAPAAINASGGNFIFLAIA